MQRLLQNSKPASANSKQRVSLQVESAGVLLRAIPSSESLSELSVGFAVFGPDQGAVDPFGETLGLWNVSRDKLN